MPNTVVKLTNVESTWLEATREDRKPLIRKSTCDEHSAFFIHFCNTHLQSSTKKLNVNEKPIHEFEAELECDVTAKDKNENPTIDRTRVN